MNMHAYIYIQVCRTFVVFGKEFARPHVCVAFVGTLCLPCRGSTTNLNLGLESVFVIAPGVAFATPLP